MRAYLLPLFGLSFLAALCEFFLPAGSMRRFSMPLFGLAVSAAALLPLAALVNDGAITDRLLPAAESVLEADAYADSVEKAYIERLTAEISARGGDATISLGENFSIDRIILTGAPEKAALDYILFTLEVPRSRVEIR